MPGSTMSRPRQPEQAEAMKNLRHLIFPGSRLPAAALAAAVLVVTLGGGAALAAPATSRAPARGAALAGVSWHKLTLLHGWKSSRSASYDVASPEYALQNGIVYLDGTLHQASGGKHEFARLPKAARPSADVFLTVLSGTPAAVAASLEIKPDGDMSITGSAARALTSLAAVSFPSARSGLAWHSLPVTGNWSGAPILGAGRASYAVRGGILYLAGSLHAKPGKTVVTDAAKLPRKDRPAYVMDVAGAEPNGDGVIVQLTPAGRIGLLGQAEAQASLDGIAFPVAGARLTWHRLKLAAGWSAQAAADGTGVPQYAADGPIIYLQGAMAFTTLSSGSSVFAFLPRPARTANVVSRVVCASDGAPGDLTIAAEVASVGSSTPSWSQEFTSLAAVSYPRNS
jgi:hypothetical protein